MNGKDENNQTNFLKQAYGYRFFALALAFQIVSFYASFEGIKLMFVAEPILAGIFASALNLSLLFCWNEFQHTTEESTDSGKTNRRSLSLLLGAFLLTMSAALSSVGMYSVMGYGSGAESDSNAEYAETLRRTKDVFGKTKDVAAKHLDDQTADLDKKLATADRRLALARSERRKLSASQDVRFLRSRISELRERKNSLAATKPNSDEKLTSKQRIAEMQTQIANMFSEYGIERDQVLAADDKQLLSHDEAAVRNIYDQLAADLHQLKPLAIACLVFGIAPDLFSVLMIFLAVPRKKLWLKIRDSKKWTASLWQEIKTGVDLPSAAAVEIVVFDENRRPLMQTAVPVDITAEVSEDSIREYFPQIISELRNYFRREFVINELPENWQQAITAGEPLELSAISV